MLRLHWKLIHCFPAGIHVWLVSDSCPQSHIHCLLMNNVTVRWIFGILLAAGSIHFIWHKAKISIIRGKNNSRLSPLCPLSSPIFHLNLKVWWEGEGVRPSITFSIHLRGQNDGCRQHSSLQHTDIHYIKLSLFPWIYPECINLKNGLQ